MTLDITYTIPGVPLLNQLKEESNPTYDCVFESNAALATAYLKKPFTGTQIKAMDPVYGPNYTGGADERDLVATMAKLGITVVPVAKPTQQELIDELHWQIEHYQHACIITMPSQWNSAVTNAGASWNPRAYHGPSHVGLACGVGKDGAEGALRIMNPWGGFWHDGSDSYWAARLIEGEIWVGSLTPTEGQPVATVTIPRGWKDDGKTLVAPNGVVVVKGFRDYVLAWQGGWEANNWPLKSEQEVTSGSIEPGNAAIGPGSRQDFRFRSLGWTASRNVYVIYSGQDLLALESQLGAANTHLAQVEAQLAALQAQQISAADLALLQALKTNAPVIAAIASALAADK